MPRMLTHLRMLVQSLGTSFAQHIVGTGHNGQQFTAKQLKFEDHRVLQVLIDLYGNVTKSSIGFDLPWRSPGLTKH